MAYLNKGKTISLQFQDQAPSSLGLNGLMSPGQEVCKQRGQHPLFQPFQMHALLLQQHLQERDQQQLLPPQPSHNTKGSLKIKIRGIKRCQHFNSF